MSTLNHMYVHKDFLKKGGRVVRVLSFLNFVLYINFTIIYITACPK